MDNAMLANKTKHELPHILSELRKLAVDTNLEWSEKFGIEPSAAITCIKPSGTVSQLVDAASGIHPRHSRHYIRTIRADNKDPMTQFLIDSGVPHEPAEEKADSTSVFAFPIKAPEKAITRNEISAVDHLKLWKIYAEHWCEHKPSITVSVRENEWIETGSFVYNNFEHMSGVSFLPMTEHTYRQAPYQDCSEKQYIELSNAMGTVDWQKLQEYEHDDRTSGTQTFACTANACESVDIEGEN